MPNLELDINCACGCHDEDPSVQHRDIYCCYTCEVCSKQNISAEFYLEHIKEHIRAQEAPDQDQPFAVAM